jgi:hypothetical protein
MKQIGFWRIQGNALRESFAECSSKRFINASWFDLLTICSVILVIIFASVALERVSASVIPELMQLNMMKITNDPGYDSLFAQAMPNLMKVILQMAIIVSSVFLLAILILSSLYAKAWGLLQPQAISFQYVRKLFFSSTLWYISWILVFILAASLLPVYIASVVAIFMVVLFVYAEQAFRALFNGKDKLLSLVKQILWLGSRHAHVFLFYELIIFLIFNIFFIVLSAAAGFLWLFWPLIVIASLFMIGFMRAYMIRLLKVLR